MGINRNLLNARPAEIGRVKVGCKGGKPRMVKGREHYMPDKFENENGPYFVITKMVRDKGGAENFVVDHALMKQLEPYVDKIDGKLRQIPCIVKSDIIDEVARTRFNKYVGTNLWCYGEGRGEGDATRFIDGKKTKVKCPCGYLDAKGDDRCKPNMIFRFTILAGEETKIGVSHAFRTTGWNSINGTIGGLEEVLETVGTLTRGVKMWLCVKWDLKKDRSGTTRRIIVVYVESRLKNLRELQQLKRDVIEERRLHLAVIQAGNPVRLGLPAPGDESKAEQAEIAAEWYPNGGESAPEYHDDDEDDEALYDLETGEVLEDEQHDEDKPSQRGTDPALPAVDGFYAEGDPNKPWRNDHPGRARLAQVLRGLAKLRNLDVRTPDKAQKAYAEILAEHTERIFDKPIRFEQLTPAQAVKVDDMVCAEARNRQEQDERDADAGDGQIPE
jgi:hypothetical protein